MEVSCIFIYLKHVYQKHEHRHVVKLKKSNQYDYYRNPCNLIHLIILLTNTRIWLMLVNLYAISFNHNYFKVQ